MWGEVDAQTVCNALMESTVIFLKHLSRADVTSASKLKQSQSHEMQVYMLYLQLKNNSNKNVNKIQKNEITIN